MSAPPGQLPQQQQQQIARPMPVTLTGGSELRFLLEREGIPDKLKDEMFSWCGDNLALTNISIDIINDCIMPSYDTVVQIIYMELGKDINFQIIRWLEELRASVELELLRATSTPGENDRERKIIATGYFEQQSQYQEQLGKKGGFFRGGNK